MPWMSFHIDYEFHLPNSYISLHTAEPAKHIIRPISLEYLHVMLHWAPATDAKSWTLRAAHWEYTVKQKKDNNYMIHSTEWGT